MLRSVGKVLVTPRTSSSSRVLSISALDGLQCRRAANNRLAGRFTAGRKGHQQQPSRVPCMHLMKAHFGTDHDGEKRAEKSTLKTKRQEAGNKLKQLWRRYGYLTIATYLGLYGCTLGGIFMTFEYDVFNASTFGYDAASLIKTVE
jgi:hypothetical protein